MTALRRIPSSLTALLAAVTIVAAAWALFVPPGQVPDESPHFAYAQSIAEDAQRPLPDDADRTDMFSTEEEIGRAFANVGETQAHPLVKPEWSPAVRDVWEQAEGQLSSADRADGGGPNPAGGNPALYYVYESLPYLVVGGELFDRWYAMRVWSMLLLWLGVGGTWLLVGELTSRNRVLQLCAATVVGLWPMATFVSAAVNPDAAVNALWPVALWLGVRMLRHGWHWRDALGLTAVTAACVLTKPVGLALLPAVVFVFGACLFQVARQTPRPRWIVPAGVALAVLLTAAAAVGADRVASPASEGGFDPDAFLSYVWQFYLPHLWFLTPVEDVPTLGLWDVWVKTGWAAFGWLEARFPDPVYVVFGVLSAAWFLAGTWALVRRRIALQPAEWVFFALAAASLLIGLHLAEWHALEKDDEAFMQGRYLFPLLPLAGLWLSAIVALLPQSLRRSAGAVVLAALFAFQVFSLAVVGGRFYA